MPPIKKVTKKVTIQIKREARKAVRRMTKLREELTFRFEDIRAEAERRFGPQDPNHQVLRALPTPSGMSMSVLEALEKRCTKRDFSNEPVPDDILSNLLYAADGINRPKSGRRTTPSTLDWRETEIYILKPNGIWRWIPEKRALLFCSPFDARHLAFFIPTPSVALPPAILVYVTNYSRTRHLMSRLAESLAEHFKLSDWNEEAIAELRERSCQLDAGVKLQSVYLAAAAMDLACEARTGFPHAKLERALCLSEAESIAAVQAVGFPAKSILDHIR